MAKNTTAPKKIITVPVGKQPQPEQEVVRDEYWNVKFEKDGYTYIIWKVSPPLEVGLPKEYDAVRLLDPKKGLEPVEYAPGLHRFTNVDPNTHFSIPGNKIREVLRNPAILDLSMQEVKVKKPKKIITLQPGQPV